MSVIKPLNKSQIRQTLNHCIMTLHIYTLFLILY